MSLWKLIHKNGNGTRAQHADAPQHIPVPGMAINPEWRSGWSPDDSGFYETRRHVGQSAEGFHAGVEVCYRVNDRIIWGEAYATPEKAREAADEMEAIRREEIASLPEMEGELNEKK